MVVETQKFPPGRRCSDDSCSNVHYAKSQTVMCISKALAPGLRY